MQQRERAQALRPAEVVAQPAETKTPAQVLRVRVYVDPAFARETQRAEQRIAMQFERASAVLEAQFNVRLEIESQRPWPSAGEARSLEAPLQALEALDPGRDVDWVAGFVPSQAVFTATQDQLGMARHFSKHFVMRGMFSAAETDALEHGLNLLGTEEREALIRERRLHKETVVLLHEWAHTLGALHESGQGLIMQPAYDAAAARYSPPDMRLIELGLRMRATPAAWADAYRALVRDTKDAPWDPHERDAAAVQTAEPQALPGADHRVYEEARALATKDKSAEAWAKLAPLVEKYPRHMLVQDFACRLAMARKAPDAYARCRAAAQFPDARTDVLLAFAQLAATREERGTAVRTLQRCEAAADADWPVIGALYTNLGACSGVERAAKHYSANDALAECAHMRTFWGLPKDLPPEREPEYVATLREAHKDIDDGFYDRAIARAERLEASFPKTGAPAVVICRAHSRGRVLSLMKTSCTQALASGAFYPHYVLGLVAAAESRWRESREALERALGIDETTPFVWMSLGAVDLKLADRAAFVRRDARYRKRFGVALQAAMWPPGWGLLR